MAFSLNTPKPLLPEGHTVYRDEQTGVWCMDTYGYKATLSNTLAAVILSYASEHHCTLDNIIRAIEPILTKTLNQVATDVANQYTAPQPPKVIIGNGQQVAEAGYYATSTDGRVDPVAYCYKSVGSIFYRNTRYIKLQEVTFPPLPKPFKAPPKPELVQHLVQDKARKTEPVWLFLSSDKQRYVGVDSCFVFNVEEVLVLDPATGEVLRG